MCAFVFLTHQMGGSLAFGSNSLDDITPGRPNQSPRSDLKFLITRSYQAALPWILQSSISISSFRQPYGSLAHTWPICSPSLLTGIPRQIKDTRTGSSVSRPAAANSCRLPLAAACHISDLLSACWLQGGGRGFWVVGGRKVRLVRRAALGLYPFENGVFKLKLSLSPQGFCLFISFNPRPYTHPWKRWQHDQSRTLGMRVPA